MSRPFITSPRSAAWHLLLVATLLFASVQDLAHEHADGIDARACYTCHFSVELGALPRVGAPAEPRSVPARLRALDLVAPSVAALRGYDARGPPLLT